MQIRVIVLVGVMLAIVSGVTLGATLFREHRLVSGGAPRVEDSAAIFNQLLDQVRSNYLEELTEADLLDGALSGVMASLDRHSKFLDARALTDLADDTSGRFGGIGIEVGIKQQRLEIIRPIPNTPAARAGLKAGDIVVGVDDYPIEAADLAGAIERLRGAPGTVVQIHLERAGEPLSVDLKRDRIKLRSVRFRELAPGVGYIRISQFRADTEQDLKQALRDMSATEGPLTGLVLDLRNNPGGLLTSSIAVADSFLESGEIVSTRGRERASVLRYAATPGDLLKGAPIVILINGGSASAAEIVAGALQDHDRATLIGSRTFGKGSVQTVMPVGYERAIKITTALYYTPNGHSIDSSGIAPDLVVNATNGGSYEEILMRTALTALRKLRKQI